MSSELSSVESGHMPLLLFVLRVLLRLWKLLADERLSGAEQRFSVTDPTSANSRAKRTLTSCSAVFDARLSLPFFDRGFPMISRKRTSTFGCHQTRSVVPYLHAGSKNLTTRRRFHFPFCAFTLDTIVPRQRNVTTRK